MIILIILYSYLLSEIFNNNPPKIYILNNNDASIERYFNTDHGIELFPDIIQGYRKNENGILFYSTYILLQDIRKNTIETEKDRYILLMKGLEITPGLYNRGLEDFDIPYEIRRTISQDNITGVVSISNILKTNHKIAVMEHAKTNFMFFNNVKPRMTFPLHPAKFGVWSYSGGDRLSYLLAIPLYFINMNITCLKPTDDTSSKILYFTELYPLRNENVLWKFLWSYYVKKMNKSYGKNWLNQLMKTYYLYPKHPNRILSDGILIY